MAGQRGRAQDEIIRDAVDQQDLRLETITAPSTLNEELAVAERRRIQEALRQSRNSKTEASRFLGMPRTTLINRMKRLGLDL